MAILWRTPRGLEVGASRLEGAGEEPTPQGVADEPADVQGACVRERRHPARSDR